MRFRNVLVTSLILVLIAAVSGPASAKPVRKSCASHTDCGAGGYCDAGKCKELSPEESFLGVGLEAATAFPAYLNIDGALIGTLPWEGIVAAGVHSIRVESQGMVPVAFQGTSTSGAVDYVPIRMVALPVSTYGGAGPTDSSPEDTGGRGVPGTLRLALDIAIGYGTAVGASNWRRPVVTLLGGGSLGLRVLTRPVWIEIGAIANSTSLLIQNYGIDTNDNGFADRPMRWGDFFKLDLGLLLRVMFPVKENFIYLGAEFSPGAGISNHNYVYGDLAISLSIFPHEMFEIFINPIGVDFAQELAAKNASFMVSYRATVGIALRFPKKPLF